MAFAAVAQCLLMKLVRKLDFAQCAPLQGNHLRHCIMGILFRGLCRHHGNAKEKNQRENPDHGKNGISAHVILYFLGFVVNKS